MLNGVKIYTTDKYWNQIFADLGADIVSLPNVADVVFDDININTPTSVLELENAVFDYMDNMNVIRRVFGQEIILPTLQHKVIVLLYKNTDITISDLKKALGMPQNVTSHVVENAIYQLRKKYGREFIKNINGKYKIGCL